MLEKANGKTEERRIGAQVFLDRAIDIKELTRQNT